MKVFVFQKPRRISIFAERRAILSSVFLAAVSFTPWKIFSRIFSGTYTPSVHQRKRNAGFHVISNKTVVVAGTEQWVPVKLLTPFAAPLCPMVHVLMVHLLVLQLFLQLLPTAITRIALEELLAPARNLLRLSAGLPIRTVLAPPIRKVATVRLQPLFLLQPTHRALLQISLFLLAAHLPSL